MKVTIEKITPERASEMLEGNTANFRNVDQKRVRLYAAEMSKGEWQVTGDTIKINPEGVLLDGQHRLMAVVRSGIAIETAVAWNVRADALPIDRGKPRTVGQYCKHRGITHATNVAAAARWCLIHDKGGWDKVTIQIDQTPDSELVEYIDAHRETLQDAVRLTNKSRHILTQSICASIVSIACGNRIPSETCEAMWFVDGLAEGSDLAHHDAVLHLRNKLAAETPRNRMSQFMKRMLATIAWNKTIRGEPCTSTGLRIRLAGPKKQQLPKYVVRIGGNIHTKEHTQ